MSEIKSKVNTKEYDENYEKIFKQKQMNLPLNEYPDNKKDELINANTPTGH